MGHVPDNKLIGLDWISNTHVVCSVNQNLWIDSAARCCNCQCRRTVSCRVIVLIHVVELIRENI